MGWSDLIIKIDEIERSPFGVYYSPPDPKLVEQYKVFLTSETATGKLKIGETEYNMVPFQKYVYSGGVLTATAMKNGDRYSVVTEDGDVEAYTFTDGKLLKRSGTSWVDGIGMATTPAIADMLPGTIYYNINRAGTVALGTTWELSKDGKSLIQGLLKANQWLVNPNTTAVTFWNGLAFSDTSLPYLLSFIADTNIKLYNDDGTPRAIPRQELIDSYPLENGLKLAFNPNTFLQHSVLLANQTDETQRWAYVFLSAAGSPTCTWYREAPNRGAVQAASGYITVEVQRTAKQGTYRCMAPEGVAQVRAFQTNSALNTKVTWRLEDPGLAERTKLAQRIAQLEEEIKKAESDTLALAEIDKLKTTIEALPAGGDTEGLTKLKEQVEALDTSKADKESVDKLNDAIKSLNDAIALGATDEELAQAKTELEAAIAAIKSETEVTEVAKRVAALEEEIKKVTIVEADPVATAQVASLETKVDGLGVDSIKSNVSVLTDQYKSLDTSKANAADLAAAQAAIKALEDAIAAIPNGSSATPEQLAAVNDRVKALESALSTAENSKGILIFDPRSHALVAGNLFGGFRRLVQADITGINERAGFGAVRPYAALNGSNTTDLRNASNQWLTWNFNQVRLWRVEITLTNEGGWANRDLKRNGTKILDLNGNAGTYTDVYTPKTTSGNELANSVQIVDDGGDTVINNLFISVTDSANPALPPTVGGVQLKVGDRFRLNYGDISSLYTYQGIDSTSGSWKATPVSASSDTNLVTHTWLDPKLERHDLALERLESQIAAAGNIEPRVENHPPADSEIDGTWRQWLWLEVTANQIRYQFYYWITENYAKTDRTVAEGPHVVNRGVATHTTATPSGEGFTNTLPNGVSINYATTLNAQNEATFSASFPAGAIARIEFESRDAQGNSLELGGQNIASDAIGFASNPFMGNAAASQILWRIRYLSGLNVEYLVPIVR